jgi:hypothetical protein
VRGRPCSSVVNGQKNSPAQHTPFRRGVKPPLLLKHLRSIRSKLRADGRLRDLAMFNLAIDSKLRGGDCQHQRRGYRPAAVARGGVRQRKAGHSVRFKFTEQTGESLDEYLRVLCRTPGESLLILAGCSTAFACCREKPIDCVVSFASRLAPVKIDQRASQRPFDARLVAR